MIDTDQHGYDAELGHGSATTLDFELCPSLAQMTQAEWEKLQRALDDLAADYERAPAGRAHPRYQVPRCKTVSPRQHLRCLCGASLHNVGNRSSSPLRPPKLSCLPCQR